jgi:hypothetical protein
MDPPPYTSDDENTSDQEVISSLDLRSQMSGLQHLEDEVRSMRTQH